MLLEMFKKFFKRMKSDREDAVKLECFDALTAAFAAFPKTCDSGLTRALVEKARDLAIVRAQHVWPRGDQAGEHPVHPLAPSSVPTSS
mgnify:CR=1 FL=1